jgi:hypothetical protein
MAHERPDEPFGFSIECGNVQIVTLGVDKLLVDNQRLRTEGLAGAVPKPIS